MSEVDILTFAAEMHCQELHMRVDETTQLKAIIAIHNTVLGPALGGCRWLEYPTTEAAVIDAIRLAQGMTYKAAISNLPLGGGKTVILKPREPIQNDQYLKYWKTFGQFVHSLNGKYITAVDSGTSTKEMDLIAQETPYVASTSHSVFSHTDPSPLTAMGVVRGIEAAVAFKLQKDSLKGVRVAIQGLGHAGYNLAQQLYEASALLTVYDIKPERMAMAADHFKAKTVPNLDALLSEPCDVFAPCALGAIINDDTVPKLQVKIVAGCANNQLERHKHGILLANKGILYAPDFVINAGGLIYEAAKLSHINEQEANEKIKAIHDTLLEIFTRAAYEKRPTFEIAETIAKERIYRYEQAKTIQVA